MYTCCNAFVGLCVVGKPEDDTYRSGGESAWSFCGGMRTSLQDSGTALQNLMQTASWRESRL